MPAAHTVFELRDYTLKPGDRDRLIDLFERHFIEPQEATGARVVATFRDLDRPDRFVWIRSFADMEARAAALNDFYTGAIWQARRDEANATMIDSDNVLLLRTAMAPPLVGARAPVGAVATPAGLVVATTYPLRPGTADAFADFFTARLAPALIGAGARVVAAFATESRPNNYPRLPVREGETVFVVLTAFDSAFAHAAHAAALQALPDLAGDLAPWLVAAPEVRRLEATARSALSARGDAAQASDFAFFTGHWRVAHRRLKERLSGSTEWEEFGGVCTVLPTLGGQGNMDDNWIDLPGGAYRALTMRAFDPAARQWSIWWLDARHPGPLDPPVVGAFKDGVGTFYADDALDGRTIRVRYLWTRTDTGAPHWEQAFSADAGATWETNWTMAFTRSSSGTGV